MHDVYTVHILKNQSWKTRQCQYTNQGRFLAHVFFLFPRWGNDVGIRMFLIADPTQEVFLKRKWEKQFNIVQPPPTMVVLEKHFLVNRVVRLVELLSLVVKCCIAL